MEGSPVEAPNPEPVDEPEPGPSSTELKMNVDKVLQLGIALLKEGVALKRKKKRREQRDQERKQRNRLQALVATQNNTTCGQKRSQPDNDDSSDDESTGAKRKRGNSPAPEDALPKRLRVKEKSEAHFREIKVHEGTTFEDLCQLLAKKFDNSSEVSEIVRYVEGSKGAEVDCVVTDTQDVADLHENQELGVGFKSSE